MTKTRFNPRLISGGVQVLALLVLLYFLNVLFQTQFYLPLPIIAELTVGILWLFLCYALSRTFGILTILGLSFAASLLWGFFLESVPASDFLNFYEGAVHVSLGEFDQLFAGKSATTVGYYAIFHWLPGPSNLTNYIASSVAWTGGAALTYRTLRYFVDDERKVRFVCAGVALCPTFLVFSPVVSSESVFFLLTAVCAWLTARHLTGRGPFPYLYILLGIATAALFLTRANGLLGLFICIFAIGAGWRGSPANIWRRSYHFQIPECSTSPGTLLDSSRYLPGSLVRSRLSRVAERPRLSGHFITIWICQSDHRDQLPRRRSIQQLRLGTGWIQRCEQAAFCPG